MEVEKVFPGPWFQEGFPPARILEPISLPCGDLGREWVRASVGLRDLRKQPLYCSACSQSVRGSEPGGPAAAAPSPGAAWLP